MTPTIHFVVFHCKLCIMKVAWQRLFKRSIYGCKKKNQSNRCVLIFSWFSIRRTYLSDYRISFKRSVSRHTRFSDFKALQWIEQYVRLKLGMGAIGKVPAIKWVYCPQPLGNVSCTCDTYSQWSTAPFLFRFLPIERQVDPIDTVYFSDNSNHLKQSSFQPFLFVSNGIFFGIISVKRYVQYCD